MDFLTFPERFDAFYFILFKIEKLNESGSFNLKMYECLKVRCIQSMDKVNIYIIVPLHK